MSVGTVDLEVITKQLGREPRGVVDIFYRSPGGTPGVIETRPCLDDGTPSPTFFYLTDPQLAAETSRLETIGVIKEMTARLESDTEPAAGCQRARGAFLAGHNEMKNLGTDFSDGDMPTRMRRLHVLIAYALAKGPDHFRLSTESVTLVTENEKLRSTAIPVNRPTIIELGVACPGVEG